VSPHAAGEPQWTAPDALLRTQGIEARPGPRPDASPLADTPWRRDERAERFANPFFTIYEDQAWNRRAERHFPYGMIAFRNRAVGILPLEPDGRVWLVGQHRYATGEFSWELPWAACRRA
jgi:8-oxo-dGDP phosphatase